MHANSDNCRRSFFKKCAVLTVGATVIGSGTELIASTTVDDWRWIGYCGSKCDKTCSYFINNQCPSCKSSSWACTIQKCARAKKVATCAHCSELDTCADKYWVNNPSKYANIKDIRSKLGTTTSVNNQVPDKQDVLLFPNPAKDSLKIQNQQNNSFNFELVNLEGKILRKGSIETTDYTLNISNLKQGTYMFKIMRNNNVLQVQKVLKL